VTLFDFLSLKNGVNVASKSSKQKNLCQKISFLLASSRSITKISGSGSESGSISQRHGSPDPDPPQNVMDPQHCKQVSEGRTCRNASIKREELLTSKDQREEAANKVRIRCDVSQATKEATGWRNC
jgi:hypothetical protein